jgi:hypothetical protein
LRDAKISQNVFHVLIRFKSSKTSRKDFGLKLEYTCLAPSQQRKMQSSSKCRAIRSRKRRKHLPSALHQSLVRFLTRQRVCSHPSPPRRQLHSAFIGSLATANHLLVAAMNKLILMDSSRSGRQTSVEQKTRQKAGRAASICLRLAELSTSSFNLILRFARCSPFGADLEIDLLSLTRGLAATSVECNK